MKEIKKIGLFGLGGINWIGGVQYITNIIHALDSISDEHPVEIHLIKASKQNFFDIDKFTGNKIVLEDIDTIFPPWSFSNRLRWFLKRKFLNRLIPRTEEFFLNNGYDFVYPHTTSDCDGKLNTAAWIADFQYYHYPDGASKEFTQAAHDEISQIAAISSKIVLSSKACEIDCNTIFPGTVGKTHCMPFTVFIDKNLLAFDNFKAITEKYRIPENFVVVSNSFCPTKNHKTLLEALSILGDQGIRIDLVCTGNIVDQRNLHFANETLQTINRFKVRSQVHLLGIIPREDQVALFRMAKAVIQPSLNEGWSTSVEEAKCLGKALVVSDIDVHKEQTPGNPYLFRRLDAADLAEKLKAAWMAGASTVYPQKEVEKADYAAYQQQVKDFGKRFLQVAAAGNRHNSTKR